MPHGMPDWGVSAAKWTVYQLQDMAELAARLGSIVTYDRRGDVVWLDDFEDNINKWLQGTGGVGASIALSTEAARNGAKSAKLTTGSVAPGTVSITRYLPLPVLGKVGLEFHFALLNTLSYVALFSIPDPANRALDGAVRYRPPENDVQILNSAGIWQTVISNLDLYESAYCFHVLKLVVDLAAEKYHRLILNDKIYDLSAYPLRVFATTGAPAWTVRVEIATPADANRSAYIDDFILTQNEP